MATCTPDLFVVGMQRGEQVSERASAKHLLLHHTCACTSNVEVCMYCLLYGKRIGSELLFIITVL